MATTCDRTVDLHSSVVRQEPDAGLRAVFLIALRYTLITTLLVGIAYPVTITALAHLTMPAKADGQLIVRNGRVIGSAIIGQNFASPRYFHPRPSAAGTGYDAANSGGSNLAPSNRALITRVDHDVADWHRRDRTATGAVPIDLVTTSASGLDPDISPEGAYFQVPAVAGARHLPEEAVRALVDRHIEERQFGFLGEPRVNVLQLNLALDKLQTQRAGNQQ
jgi:K+-transporting ATPase ATPase C chain